MAGKRCMITIDPAIANLIDKAAGTGSASDYIAAIVQQRWMAWTHALTALRDAGWASAELCAACDALNGHWMLGTEGVRPQAIALELFDAQRLNKICSKWSVPTERWQERVEQVRGSYELAHAISTVVQEFWSGNAACEAAVRGSDASGTKYVVIDGERWPAETRADRQAIVGKLGADSGGPSQVDVLVDRDGETIRVDTIRVAR